METMEELQERHRKEARELVATCPHNKLIIEDGTEFGTGNREVTLRCELCRLNLTTWGIYNGKGEFHYVRGWTKDIDVLKTRDHFKARTPECHNHEHDVCDGMRHFSERYNPPCECECHSAVEKT